MKGFYKILLAVATLVVLGHNLTPHHHHSLRGSVTGQWQQNNEDDGHDELLSTFQLDHSFSSNENYATIVAHEVIVTEVFQWIASLYNDSPQPAFEAYADTPPDRQAFSQISFRGPPTLI